MSWKNILIGAVLFLAFTGHSYAGKPMTQKGMESVITDMAEMSQGRDGLVKFKFHGIPMAVISDVKHNRMRIISPIKTYTEITSKQIDAMMEANFHSALDARYAVSDGVLYSAFIHPLSSLSKSDIESAVRQVGSLLRTFGSTYSSGELSFGGGRKKSKQSGT